jgi:uncharacterized protein YxjI
MNEFEQRLSEIKHLHVQQIWEGLELLGFETRNKYKILDESQRPIAYAAEQATGFGGAILRHFFGHWRSFKVTIFDNNRKPIYTLEFPFRFFFKDLFVKDTDGKLIGHLEQQFAIFRKKFTVYGVHGRPIARINSSFFKLWSFEFFARNRSIGKIEKKWSGMLSEVFTDKDNFIVNYTDPESSVDTKALMLATCLMVDIIYFENNQGSRSLLDLVD